MVLCAMQDLFGVSMSLGTVTRLRQEASVAVATPVEEAQQYVQQQPVVGVTTKRNKTRQPWTTQLVEHDRQTPERRLSGFVQFFLEADETSWTQGNADGANERGTKVAAVTPLVTCFQVLLSRSAEAAQTLLGATNGCILTSDRHGGYNWVDLSHRQLCWAHMSARIHQDIRAPWCFWAIGRGTGKASAEVIRFVASRRQKAVWLCLPLYCRCGTVR
jgi:hypothetical protein